MNNRILPAILCGGSGARLWPLSRKTFPKQFVPLERVKYKLYPAHRAKHWVVVAGSAVVTRGEEVLRLTKNESTYIPVGVAHRLENPGETSLEMIEIQTGNYLGEDDIVKLENKYGRD